MYYVIAIFLISLSIVGGGFAAMATGDPEGRGGWGVWLLLVCVVVFLAALIWLGWMAWHDIKALPYFNQ